MRGLLAPIFRNFEKSARKSPDASVSSCLQRAQLCVLMERCSPRWHGHGDRVSCAPRGGKMCAPHDWYAVLTTYGRRHVIERHDDVRHAHHAQVERPVDHELAVLLVAIDERHKDGRVFGDGRDIAIPAGLLFVVRGLRNLRSRMWKWQRRGWWWIRLELCLQLFYAGVQSREAWRG